VTDDRGDLMSRTPTRRPAPLVLPRAAVGALAAGSFAVGALAVGALFIGRVVVGRAEVKQLKIGRLEVGELTVLRSTGFPAVTGQPPVG
jgi:hypothetical protein